MSYLALYRRFRPQVFEDLIGQETVVKALVNQIKTDKIGHAYLFCGARGTGKTTAAKIFARAINCQEKNGSPCGKCSACQSLSDPNSLDIVEMDAASNNRVENVREIREKVQYPPVNGRFKVYIIDEVHMLTPEAFNALLKTLEEPPKHAVFILATTEPHKLPATILSRCMRFDFKLIPVQKIAKLISKIYDEVGKAYEPEAVTCIARAGEGSVRDALSVADICLSYNNEKLTYNDVIDVLGSSNRQKTAELIKCMFTQDAGGALTISDELLSLGKNVGMLIKDLLSFLRDVMVVKTCKNPNDILSLPIEDINLLNEIASLTDNNALLRMVEILSKTENDIKYSTHPKIIFEASIVKATNQSADFNLDAIMSRISKLERALEGGGFKTAEPKKETIIKEKVVDNERIDALLGKLSDLEKRIAEVEKSKIEVANNEKTKVESKKTNDSFSGGGFEREFDDVPPSDLFDVDFDSLKRVDTEKTIKEEVKEKAQEPSEKPSSTVPDRRIWGTLIKRLRETGNTMLWVMCQELESSVNNGVLTVYVSNAREKESITKEPNFTNFKAVLREICTYKVEVVIKNENIDDFDKDVEKLKSDFDKLDIED